MRIPVFARRANPAIDRPIVRKSFVYCFEQVEAGVADWVNESNPRHGIIAREYLPSGKALPADLETCSGPMPYLKFVRPKPQPSEVLRVQDFSPMDKQLSERVVASL